MKKLILAALVGLLPAVALADTTISGPITFSTGLHVVGSKVTLDGTLPAAANPTATIGTAAVNGSAGTFMRSDAAPAIPQASSSVFGAVKVDGTTITASGGVISAAGGGGSPASPFNSLQKNAAGSFGAAALSDDSTTITATEPVVITPDPVYAGSELLSNPTFVANDTGWTLGDCSSWLSGQFVTTLTACADPSISASIATVAGNTYLVTYNFTITGDQSYVHFANNTASSNGSSGPTETFAFVANYTGTDTVIFDFFNYNPAATRTITSPISVRQITPSSPLSVLSFGALPIMTLDRVAGSVVLGNKLDCCSSGLMTGKDNSNGSNGGGGGLMVRGGDGDSPGGSGGFLYLRSGLPNGSLTLQGEGSINITAGNGNIIGQTDTNGAPVIVSTGPGSTGNSNGGDLTLQAASGSGTGRNGVVILSPAPTSCTSMPSGTISKQTVGGVGDVLVLCP